MQNKKITRLLTYVPALILVIFFSYRWRYFQLDDALIYLRYIKNFQNGFGLVYNPGERFNGLTSPLYSYITLLLSFVVSNLQILSISLSGLFLFIASALGGELFSESIYGKVLTSVAVASFGYFYFTFGMETTLFLALIVASLYLYKIQSNYLVIALALLVNTRSEGVFLALPLALDAVARKRLPPLKFIIAAALLFLVPFVINYIYYGSPLPATGSAKIGQGKSGLWGERWIFLNSGYLDQMAFSGNKIVRWIFVVLSAAGAIILVRKRAAFYSLIFIFLLFSFYSLMNIPNYHWYYAPFFYFGILFSSRALESLACWIGGNFGRLARAGAIGVFLCGVAYFFFQTSASVATGNREDYAKIGIWLKNNTPPNASVAMVEVGTVGWYADRNIIDILGLTNKYNADFIARRDFTGWFEKYQPDYILRHEPRWGHEQSTEILEGQRAYIPDERFNFPGYVLLRKSPYFSNADIAKISVNFKKSKEILMEMMQSTNVTAPFVQIEGDHIFAHAPSELSIRLPKDKSKIDFFYGIREGAAGKHHGICFDLFLKSSGANIFHDCIQPETAPQDMRRSKSLNMDNIANDTLIFRNNCESSCDYAWSYWGVYSLD